MSKATIDVPRKGGFSFDLCKRNAMLGTKGAKALSYRKTGTTIVGLKSRVSLLELNLMLFCMSRFEKRCSQLPILVVLYITGNLSSHIFCFFKKINTIVVLDSFWSTGLTLPRMDNTFITYYYDCIIANFTFLFFVLHIVCQLPLLGQIQEQLKGPLFVTEL